MEFTPAEVFYYWKLLDLFLYSLLFMLKIDFELVIFSLYLTRSIFITVNDESLLHVLKVLLAQR